MNKRVIIVEFLLNEYLMIELLFSLPVLTCRVDSLQKSLRYAQFALYWRNNVIKGALIALIFERSFR